MKLTKRGRWVVAGASALVVVGATVAAFALSRGEERATFVPNKDEGGRHNLCPLTARRVEDVPDRPVLAIKVDNAEEARPQAGLDLADIVYEEPVEGGLTRFVALFQCHDAERIGPVRSARSTDPAVLRQYGQALFGYAGSLDEIQNEIEASNLVDLNFESVEALEAYRRDLQREPPYNLYTSTEALYGTVEDVGPAPDPVFTFRVAPPDGRSIRGFTLEWSDAVEISWHWNANRQQWVRFLGESPHQLEEDRPVTAANVIVQVVDVEDSEFEDLNGEPSPLVDLLGTGVSYVFRDGRVVAGSWFRRSAKAVTKFLDRDGRPVPLKPGSTWVELLPSDAGIAFA